MAWSRLGSAYRPEHLKQALEDDRTLFEHNATIRPMTDLGLFFAGGADGWTSYERPLAWVRDNDAFRRDILDRLAGSGPLTSRDIPDTCAVPWASTGWTHNRNVTQMLEFLMLRGEVAISGRVGRERVWDLAERVYPADVVIPSVEEAQRIRNERRLRALGIARRKTTAMPVEPIDVGDAGEPAVVEGVRRRVARRPGRRSAATSKAARRSSPRSTGSSTTAPAPRSSSTSSTSSRCTSRRPSGASVTSRCPILHGDRMVGKVDAAADRKAGVLRVNAIHEDVKFTRAIAKAVQAELDDLAEWLGLEPARRRRCDERAGVPA